MVLPRKNKQADNNISFWLLAYFLSLGVIRIAIVNHLFGFPENFTFISLWGIGQQVFGGFLALKICTISKKRGSSLPIHLLVSLVILFAFGLPILVIYYP